MLVGSSCNLQKYHQPKRKGVSYWQIFWSTYCMFSLSSGLSLCSFVSPTFIYRCNNQPTFVEVKKCFCTTVSVTCGKKLKLSFYHLMYIFHFSLSPLFQSCLLFLHPPAFSPPFSPPLPSLFFCLCDVRYGIADFQTAPVDSSCNGEQSEHHQQGPCNVDPFGVRSWLPCAHLNKWS